MSTATSNPQTGERPRPQSNLESNDPYEVLGLKRGATLREIKRAYFTLVREYPPEKEVDAFKIIRAAYEKLRNPDAKSETDLFLFRAPSIWTARKRKKKLQLDFNPADLVSNLLQHSDIARDDFEDDFRQVRV